MNQRIAHLAEVQFQLWNARTPRIVARQPRVLIVEPDRTVREQHRELAQRLGCEVEAVHDGEAAIMKLAFQHFDLLITDWRMPRLDGVSLVVWLRAMFNRMPVIMVAQGPLADLPAPASKEMQAIFAKPVAAGRLLHAMAQVLQRAEITVPSEAETQVGRTVEALPLESLRPFRI